MRFTAANEHGDASNGPGYTDRQHTSSDVLGVDTDGDQSADQYVDASAVASWGQVVSVRVSLLMATPPSAGPLSSTAQTYTYNGTSSTATDRRVRHVYSSTVNVRNRTK